MTESLEPLLEGLTARQSATRRSAAKKLRKLANPKAGPALLAALHREVEDARTWETQYQMIMALGESLYAGSKQFIVELALRPFEATMVYVAIGDALVRLSDNHKIETVLNFVKHSQNASLIDGGFRAMAMLRLVPSDNEIEQIISYACRLMANDENRFWILAACPGWPPHLTQGFLDAAATSTRSDFQEAIRLAGQKKYKVWRPL